ncbi:hypothetical protein FH972_012064 [Carpinus fangiana]|uniref:F-box domain-containing protein n=1 Tax=Carpinus fangiana TaxID=176857 RepID=A0A5N6R630_9ROSI|nr:hypothetical protein FH972_012064 [Carpinus fangiana]
MASPENLGKKKSIPVSPKTPRDEGYESESRLESLPLEILVNVLCHLHHDRDQLKAVFHVSPRLREAIVIARRVHFNYVTPDALRVTKPPPIKCEQSPPSQEEWEEFAIKRREVAGFFALGSLLRLRPVGHQQIDDITSSYRLSP